MRQIETFGNVIGTPSGVENQLDSPGSSQDRIFAEAIIANEPTSVLEEAGIITVRVVPDMNDEIAFPLFRNTQLTWVEIDARTGSNALGSDLAASGLNQVVYKVVRPTTRTANIFLPDEVSLLNKINFDLYAQNGATDAKRFKEFTTLTTLFTQGNHTAPNIKIAGGFTAGTGSVNAGSLIDPSDMVKSKRLLSTGSDINVPDFALMHPNQYATLNKHEDFAPGAVTPGAIMRKANFNDDGDITRFDGIDIFVSELVPSSGSPGAGSNIDDASYSGTGGHNIVIGARGRAIGRGEHFGMKVSTEDSRRRHGSWKIFDISFADSVLMEESLVLLKCADEA